MKIPPERQNWRLMREMFTAIAPRYDFVTRVFSFGMDRRWKRLGVESISLPERPVVLDLACGTGDFSRLLLERLPQARVVAVDLTEEMLRLARKRGPAEAVCADASALPFADAWVDCIFIGYGLRNFPNLDRALREIERVTRPGGLLVSLDFFLPANRVLRKIYLAYLYVQGALWGMLLHGRPRVYTYIPDSLRNFVSIQEFIGLLHQAGYSRVETTAHIFGGIGLHCAIKG